MTKAELEAGKAIDLVNEKLVDQLDVLTKGGAGATISLAAAWGSFTEELGKNITESETFIGATLTANKVLSEMTTVLGAEEGGGVIAAVAVLANNLFSAGEESRRLAAKLEAVAERKRILETPLELVSAVTGKEIGAPGQKRSKPPSGKKRPSVAMGGFGSAAFAGDLTEELATKEAAWAEERNRYAAHLQLLDDLDRQTAEGKRELAQSQLDYQLEISTMIQADQQAALQKQKQSFEEMKNNISGAANVVGGSLAQLFTDIGSGSEDAAQKFAANMLTGIGHMLFGKGTADMVAAIASGIIYGNFAGIEAAGAEMAVGAGLLMAGGAAAPTTGGTDARGQRMIQNLQQQGRGGEGGGAGDFAAGGGGTAPRAGAPEEKTIVINLQGPVYDGPAAGVAIMEKLKEAKQQGF
jgi:hypothetical protein